MSYHSLARVMMLKWPKIIRFQQAPYNSQSTIHPPHTANRFCFSIEVYMLLLLNRECLKVFGLIQWMTYKTQQSRFKKRLVEWCDVEALWFDYSSASSNVCVVNEWMNKWLNGLEQSVQYCMYSVCSTMYILCTHNICIYTVLYNTGINDVNQPITFHSLFEVQNTPHH